MRVIISLSMLGLLLCGCPERKAEQLDVTQPMPEPVAMAQAPQHGRAVHRPGVVRPRSHRVVRARADAFEQLVQRVRADFAASR